MMPPEEVRTIPGWQLDELASAGRENLDAVHVSKYDEKENADAAEEVVLLTSLGLNDRSTVVDLGAGTGQFAIAVAASCARVVAVDVSPVMLRSLRSKAAAAGTPNLEVVRAGFLTYEHSGEFPDFVYSRYALHHLPDFWKAVALTRIHRLLAPDGIVRLWDVVYGFPPTEVGERVDAWCAVGSDDVGDGWNRAELEEHVRDENSTFTWLLEPMMQQCGFEIVDATYSDDRFFAKYLLEKR